MATAIPGLYEIHMFPPQIQFQTWSINWNFKFNFKSMSSAAESSYNVNFTSFVIVTFKIHPPHLRGLGIKLSVCCFFHNSIIPFFPIKSEVKTIVQARESQHVWMQWANRVKWNRARDFVLCYIHRLHRKCIDSALVISTTWNSWST